MNVYSCLYVDMILCCVACIHIIHILIYELKSHDPMPSLFSASQTPFILEFVVIPNEQFEKHCISIFMHIHRSHIFCFLRDSLLD